MDADEQARRNLAIEVRNAVVEGGRVVGIGPVAEIARGVSAVVLASSLRAPGECCCVRRDGQVMEVRVGSCRQGWRARLANIERLLTEVEGHTIDGRAALEQALAEVRAMLDNPAGGE